MGKPKSEYILTRLKKIDELLEISLQESKRSSSMQRVRQARQTISGLSEEIGHDARKKAKKHQEESGED